MTVKVHIRGAIVDKKDATVSVFDRGFLYGDSVYEVMRTSGGEPVDFERHIARLLRSAHAIAIAPPDVAKIEGDVRDTLAAAANPESYIRIVLTRGGGVVGLDVALADEPRTIVIVKPLVLPTDEQYETGVALAIVGVERMSRRAVDPSVKSGNYLNNILALAEAHKSGADEAIMLNPSGDVAEGSTSNLFVVEGSQITTPQLSTGLLAGITRQRVLELCAEAGMAVVEAELSPERVRNADEAFITSSIRGVLPVASVDGRRLPAGAPGAVTQRILQLYSRFLAAVATRANA